jgi:SAM-dependent methyltransferase
MMLTLEQLVSQVRFPTHRDRDFFIRVYQTPRDVYATRLRAIGFEGCESVLDAACGFGQWAVTLASINDRVDAFDLSPLRVAALKSIAAAEGVNNLYVCRSTLDVLPYRDGAFDAVFCYGAVFFTDYRRTFAEFARVLRPGGRLYFTANALGWYIYNLIAAHKPSRDFSPRRMATRALVNTARFAAGRHSPGDEIAMSAADARRSLDRAGFEVVGIAGDGELAVGSNAKGRSFFVSHHYGLRAVFEVLCEKR